MNLCRLKTVLFDLDGTLLDTAADLGFAINKLAEQQGLPPLPMEKIRPVASDGSKALLKLAFDMDDTHPEFESYRENFFNFYQQHLSVGTKLFPGMDKVLDQLDQYQIKWGVVTNKATRFAKDLLTDLELADRCCCIVGGCCVPRLKPHPDSLLLACELSECAPKECVYVGDHERDIEAAKFAGMRSIAALYGYLAKDASPEFWNADYYIDQPQDLLCWLEKQRSINPF
jgi:2-phosphoglycolate phosphatase